MESENVESEAKEVKTDSIKNYRWFFYLIGVLVVIIIVILLVHGCDGGGKYKIKLHYGDETIEVGSNFKLSSLDVDGGTITFLVDSDGHVVDPKGKLDPKKEYSAHIIPDGKEKVKVTYKWDDKSLTIEYQKGAGLLFPDDPKKTGYTFIAWKYENIDDYPLFMMPVTEDMTLVAEFEKNKLENGKCILNCDTNNDGSCDLNCDKNGDGKADTNIDTNGDGKPDMNVDQNHDGICELNCDKNSDGKADTNIDTNGDGSPDLNIDTDGDGKCDINCDVDGDGKCDKSCEDGSIIEQNFTNPIHFTCTSNPKNAVAFYRIATCKLVYFEFDGKEIPESEFKDDGGYKEYDYSSYIGSGKTVGIKLQVIYTDGAGQKYYRNHDQKITFDGDCDAGVYEYTLTFNPNGGKVSPTSVVLLEGQLYSDLPTPTKDGYTFDGWYTLASGGEQVTKDTKMGNKDTTIYAHWTKTDEKQKTYKLTYDANGGKVSPSSKTVKDGEKIGTLPTPTKEGYTFDGWYIKGSEFKVNANSTIDRDTTLFAHWIKKETQTKTYTITLNANGGTVSSSSTTVKEGEKVGTLPTPTKDGYTFDGWYTSASGGNKVDSNSTISSDTTLYAHWSEEKDNGTISLTATSECLVAGSGIRINATVNNAKDETITWTGDRCLTVSGNGKTASVSGSGCGRTATVTGTLKNGAKASVTLNFESKLTYRVTDRSGNTVNIDSYSGKYEGNNLTVTANISSYIKGSGLLGDESSLRTSATTSGAVGTTVTITTPCGQKETLSIAAIIN